MIRKYLGNGSKYAVKIDYVQDPYPLGDAGSFKYIYNKIDGTAILANADEIRKGLNLEDMLESHIKKSATATMAVIEQPDVINHGIVELNRNKRITKFLMNPSQKETDSNYANSGFYLMEKDVLKYFPEGPCMMKNVPHQMVDSKRLYGFAFEGAYFNVGTPEAYKKAHEYFQKLEKV